MTSKRTCAMVEVGSICGMFAGHLAVIRRVALPVWFKCVSVFDPIVIMESSCTILYPPRLKLKCSSSALQSSVYLVPIIRLLSPDHPMTESEWAAIYLSVTKSYYYVVSVHDYVVNGSNHRISSSVCARVHICARTRRIRCSPPIEIRTSILSSPCESSLSRQRTIIIVIIFIVYFYYYLFSFLFIFHSFTFFIDLCVVFTPRLTHFRLQSSVIHASGTLTIFVY